MAKNGILIVEFANQLRDEGRTIRDAVLEASAIRLRPIVMTVVATILGAVPLAIASGAGAESRAAIGIVVIGGLALASLLTLFVTPVLYDLLAQLHAPDQRDREGAQPGACRAHAGRIAGFAITAPHRRSKHLGSTTVDASVVMPFGAAPVPAPAWPLATSIG